MLLLYVAMKHNSVYILLADTYDFIKVLPYSRCLHLLITGMSCIFWLGHKTVKVQWGEPPWIFHTTTVPKFQDFSPEGFHGDEKERSKVYSVISAMNWSEIKLGDCVTWNASDRIFSDWTIKNKFSREEWQPCLSLHKFLIYMYW